MTRQEIIDLFPIEAQITQEIIDKAVLTNSSLCIGALTLEGVRPEGLHNKITWGVTTGTIYLSNNLEGGRIIITTSEEIDMMDVTEPQSVKFVYSCTIY